MPNPARVTTALLLAAGTGTRLRPLTLDAPKCLTIVGGRPILDRLVCNLREQGIEKLIVVLGYMGDQIRDFLNDHAGGMKVEYVLNPEYATTNNIYSLWLAREHINESFLLVESDLVFDAGMLDNMFYPDKIAVSHVLPWMNGTQVSLGPDRRVTAFHAGGNRGNESRYKTVNICSLSLQSWQRVAERIGRFISEQRRGEYYEAVFDEMTSDGTLSFEAVFFDSGRWYEIDSIADLEQAETLYETAPALKEAAAGHA
jgi:choline kinase